MQSCSEKSKSNPVIMSWSTHRLLERPARLLFVVPCLLLAGFAGARMLGSPVAGLLGAALLAAAIGDYLFPVRCELRSRSAVTSCLFSRSEIAWERVRKVWLTKDGIKLSPLPRKSRLEAFRGVYLPFGHDSDAVLEAVRRLRDGAAASEDARS